MNFRRLLPIFILTVIFIFIAIPRLRFPDLDHGDDYADGSILNAAENFARYGFIKCRFLPLYEPDKDKPDKLYTHYPPLGENFNGLLRILTKSSSLYNFRVAALLFSLLSIIFWYFFIREVTQSLFLGLFFSILYLTNPMVIFGIDSLGIPLSDLFRSLILLLFARMLSLSGGKKGIAFLCLWVLFMLSSLINYEYIIFLFIFFLLYKVVFKKSKRDLSLMGIFILFLAPVCAFLLHLFQNSWYFGSFSAAMQDLRHIAAERVAASKDSPVPLNLINWWQLVIMRNYSLVFIFNYSIIAAFSAFAFVLYRLLLPETRRKINLALKLSLLFMLCGMTWYMVFPSHSLAHTFVFFLARHLAPFAALSFAIFCYIVFSFVSERYPDNPFGRVILGALIIIIVLTGAFKSNLPITAEGIAGSKDFLIFKKSLLDLRAQSRPKDRVGVNYFRFPFICYYLSRGCDVVFDKPSLEKLPRLPRYFIFMPYQYQPAMELSQFLNQRYDILYQCRSGRFPAVFFKLKE